MFPGELDRALASWLASNGSGSLAAPAQALSKAYASGGSSTGVSLAAYLVARLPATFAAVRRVLAEVARLRSDITAPTLLDVGAGPGTAGWAALAQWPDAAAVTQLEQDAAMLALARALNAESAVTALITATTAQGTVQATELPKAGIVLASYVLAELPQGEAAVLARRLWAAAEDVLVIIEPGTPQGFARIRLAREALLADGARMLAPCTHALACPMQGTDWCHFKVRVQRSRAHMQAKGATVPFEDEPFSYIAVSRQSVPLPQGRIIAPPHIGKAVALLPLCREGALPRLEIARRAKAAYKQAKHARWGDAWPPAEDDAPR